MHESSDIGGYKEIDQVAPEAFAERVGPAERVEGFIDRSPGLREPRIYTPPTNLPVSVPAWKEIITDIRASDPNVVDQTAGDIALLGQPLSDELLEAQAHLRATHTGNNGELAFPRIAGEMFEEHRAEYIPTFPTVVRAVADRIGLKEGEYMAMDTGSGRTAIGIILDTLNLPNVEGRREMQGRIQSIVDHTVGSTYGFKKMIQDALNLAPGRTAIIGGPLMWPGYGESAKNKGRGIELVNAPAVKGHGLDISAQGVEETLAFMEGKHIKPMAIVPIAPNNPTGESLKGSEMVKLIKLGAARGIPVFLDAFYAPLHEQGEKTAIPMAYLREHLAPEELAHLSILVGHTKTLSSNTRYSVVLSMAPKGHEAMARKLMGTANAIKSADNCYPTPQAALGALSLWGFKGSMHTAMGPRYDALQKSRVGIRQMLSKLGMGGTIGHSFYGVGLMQAPDGSTLFRGKDGTPITDPKERAFALAKEGICAIPGGALSEAPEAPELIRFSATATPADLERMEDTFKRLIDRAIHHA